MARLKLVTVALAIAGLAASMAAAHAQSSGAATAGAPQADAQEHQAHHPAAETPPAKSPDGAMSPGQKAMMADMQARAAKIEALLASMNAAKGAVKVDALAAVVTAMAEQQGDGAMG